MHLLRLALLLAALGTLAGAGPALASSAGALTVTPDAPQAAAHADLTLRVDVAGGEGAADDPRELRLELPPGLLANAASVPRCTDAEFAATRGTDADPRAGCADATQIGAVTAQTLATTPFGRVPAADQGELHLIEPQAGEVARLGIFLHSGLAAPLRLEAAVRVRGDLGLTAVVEGLPRSVDDTVVGDDVPIDLTSITTTLFGTSGARTADGAAPADGVPFVTMPSTCAPATVTAQLTAYDAPQPTPATSATLTPTGCDAVPFTPAVRIASLPDGAPGVVIDRTQPTGTATQAESPVRTSTITLPFTPGLSGLCPAAALALASTSPSPCPPASRLGAVRLDTPALGPLDGSAYLANDGTGYRVLFDVADPRGAVRFKSVGRVAFVTGGVAVTIDDLPDVLVTSFAVTLYAGPCVGELRVVPAAFTAVSGARATPVPVVALAPAGCISAPAVPAVPTPGTSRPAPALPPAVAALRVAPRLVVARQAGALRAGVLVRPGCSRACRASVRLTIAGSTARRLGLRPRSWKARVVTVGRATTTRSSVRVRLSARARTRIRAVGLANIMLTARVTATAGSQRAAGSTAARLAR